MRQYLGLVFDDWVSGLATVFTPTYLDTVLGQFEQLAVQAIVTRAGGSSPRLNVALQHSSNGRQWMDRSDLPAIDSANLTAGSVNVLVGIEAGGPGLAYARWLLRLEGTNPRAYVRLWMTGRGKGSLATERAARFPLTTPAVGRASALGAATRHYAVGAPGPRFERARRIDSER